MTLAVRWRSLLGGLCALGLALVLVACGGGGEPRRPAEPAVGRSGLVVGVAANAIGQDIRRTVRVTRGLDVRWMREQTRWAQLEPRRGQWDFTRYDELMVETARRGVRVLPLLYGTPRWAGAARQNRLPPRLAEWEAFVRRVVGRYGPGGRFWREHPELDAGLAPRVWEVWNEPYLPYFSRPAPDPARYAQLLRATVTAGRETAPGTRYLAAMETSYVAADGTTRDWLADLLAADPRLGEVLDGLAVHPYSLSPPGQTTGEVPFGRFARLNAALERAGIGARPVWITELGYSTCGTRPPCVSPQGQARRFEQVLDLLAGRYRGEVDAFFAYQLDDLPSSGPDDLLADYGLLRRDGRPKPAAAVLRAAARASARRP